MQETEKQSVATPEVEAPKIEEKGRLRIQNLKRVEDNYSDNEKALIEKMLEQSGIEKKGAEETSPETEVSSEENKTEDGKVEEESKGEENSEEKEVNFLLSELIGLDKEPEVKEEKNEEPQEYEDLTDVEIENLKLKKQIEVTEASDKIEELLGNYEGQEKETLREYMVKLLEKGFYNNLNNSLSVDEKTAYLLIQAKGLSTDKLKKVAEENAEAKAVLESATVTPQAKQRGQETDKRQEEKLRELSRNGDRRATVALHRSDPVIDRIIARNKKT